MHTFFFREPVVKHLTSLPLSEHHLLFLHVPHPTFNWLPNILGFTSEMSLEFTYFYPPYG